MLLRPIPYSLFLIPYSLFLYRTPSYLSLPLFYIRRRGVAIHVPKLLYNQKLFVHMARVESCENTFAGAPGRN
jgi:hypothetical protein